MLRKTFASVFVSAFFIGCDIDMPCENEISQTIISPNGTLKAVVFSRNCGATTGFNTQISALSSKDALPDEGGNLFIADGEIPVKLKWQGESELQVAVSDVKSLVKKESQAQGIKVRYE